MSTTAPRHRTFRVRDDASDLQAVWVPEAGMLGASRSWEVSWPVRRRGSHDRRRAHRGLGVAQLFALPGEDYVCIEPMTAPANALVRGGLEWVAPGERRRAAFRIVCD